jgi:hypothetical protein
MSADERSYISDATRIKAELRATNQRIDSLSDRVDKRVSDLKDSLASARLWALVPWAVLVTAALFYALSHGFKGG